MKKKRASQEEILKMMGRYQKTKAAEPTLPPLQEIPEPGGDIERALKEAIRNIQNILMPEVFVANKETAEILRMTFGDRKDMKIITVEAVEKGTVYHVTDNELKKTFLAMDERGI